MKRRLLNVLTALSLLLCVAVAALWVRSYWVLDSIERRSRWVGQNPDDGEVHHDRNWEVAASRGAVAVRYNRNYTPAYASRWAEVPEVPVVEFEHWSFPAGGPPTRYFDPDGEWLAGGRWGFGGMNRVTPTWTLRGAVVPCYALVATTAAGPLAWAARRWRGRLRRRAGACGTCGYDLRATPGRCPECGQKPAGPEKIAVQTFAPARDSSPRSE